MKGTTASNSGSLAEFPRADFTELLPRESTALSNFSQLKFHPVKFQQAFDRSQSCLANTSSSKKVFETYNVLTDKKEIRVKAVPPLQRPPDFQSEYKKILGSQFLTDVNRNPYLLASSNNTRSQEISIGHRELRDLRDHRQSTDSSASHSDEGSSSKQVSPVKFGQRMGYFRHLIEKQGLHQKKSLMHFTRDGNRFIRKEPRDNFDSSIDPEQRCDRHDRHQLLPGERHVPLPKIPTLYQNEACWSGADSYFHRSKSSLIEDDLSKSCFVPATQGQDQSQEWVNQSHVSFQRKDWDKSRGTSILRAKKEDESPLRYFGKSSLSSMGQIKTLNGLASDSASTASIRTIKDLTLKKMLSKGLHHDGKSGDKTKIMDSMERNVKDFKKIFEKLRLSARAFQKPENSPYYQSQFNRYMTLQGMVENEIIAKQKRRAELELARMSPVKDLRSIGRDPKVDLMPNNNRKEASLSYLDESTNLLEHDQTIPEPTEEAGQVRKETMEAIDSRDASPLKSHRHLPAAVQSEIRSEMEKSKQLRQLAQTAIEAFDGKEFQSRAVGVHDTKKGLNTLQPSKSEESDKEFKVKSQLVSRKEKAVRTKASQFACQPQHTERSSQSKTGRSRNHEDRVQPVVHNQSVPRPRASNSKRVPLRSRQTYCQQKTNSSNTTNKIKYIEQIEDQPEKAAIFSQSVIKERAENLTKDSASLSNGLFADSSLVDSRYSSVLCRPTIKNYPIIGRETVKGTTPCRHGPDRRYEAKGFAQPPTLNKRLHQSALQEHEASFLGCSQTSSIEEFCQSFEHKRKKSEINFKLEKQIRDQAAKDRIIQALTQREKEAKISILNSNGKKLKAIPKLNQRLAEASTSGTSTQLVSSRQNALTLVPGQKMAKLEGARPYFTGSIQNY